MPYVQSEQRPHADAKLGTFVPAPLHADVETKLRNETFFERLVCGVLFATLFSHLSAAAW